MGDFRPIEYYIGKSGGRLLLSKGRPNPGPALGTVGKWMKIEKKTRISIFFDGLF